ncbi:MAG: TlpA family protein disulfide reductase, partial [Armatimonadetes bacterium]|nr:TlpA family protein disulfide reductase [Armatimonadota bacterium]
ILLTLSFFASCTQGKKESAREKTSLISSEAINFSLPDIKDKKISLREFKNKKAVLLVFWATWCPYCLEEIPKLRNLHKEFSAKNFEILAVNIKQKKPVVSAFMDDRGIKYPVLFDYDGRVAKSYNIFGIPTNIIIDKGGKIIYHGNELPENINELIKGLL